jgi:hypothetical protein
MGGEPSTTSMGVVVPVFHRARYYRDALRSVADQEGPLPRVEIVVVRSPDVEIEVPSRLNTRGWDCTVVRSEAIGEGPFLADGLRHLTTDVVVPLDDDDLWAPDRLRRVTAAIGGRPDVAYYHNGQTYVGADGAEVPDGTARRHLRRFAGSPSGRIREVTQGELRRHPGALARWGSYFNNSSIAIRRSVLAAAGDDLRKTPRLIDSFMFYASAASGASLLFDPAPLTRYRIHDWNRSRGSRTLGPFEVSEPSQTRQGRLASLDAMRAMARREGAGWVEPWLQRDLAYFDLLEGLREGDVDRVRAVRRTARLARYLGYVDPLMNAVLAVTALGQAAAPAMAHRAYWGSEEPAGEGASRGAGTAPPRTP